MMLRPDEVKTRRGMCSTSTSSITWVRVLRNPVDMRRLKQGVMTALLAAFMTLFALTTAVDAATCAVEAAFTSTEQASASPSDTQPGDLDEGRGVCSHCLCHHGTAPPPQAAEPTVVNSVIVTVPVASRSFPMASCAPSGPKRPPRA